jgi:hypothetical protein
MPEKIEGQVARILNDRELVINRGEEHGVEVGMRFAVLTQEGLDVTDPETGELLGDIQRPKTLVKVNRVLPKFAVAATYRTKVTGGIFDTLAVFGPRTKVEETLRAEDDLYAHPLSDEESKVNRGDKVVQVEGNEYLGWDW